MAQFGTTFLPSDGAQIEQAGYGARSASDHAQRLQEAIKLLQLRLPTVPQKPDMDPFAPRGGFGPMGPTVFPETGDMRPPSPAINMDIYKAMQGLAGVPETTPTISQPPTIYGDPRPPFMKPDMDPFAPRGGMTQASQIYGDPRPPLPPVVTPPGPPLMGPKPLPPVTTPPGPPLMGPKRPPLPPVVTPPGPPLMGPRQKPLPKVTTPPGPPLMPKKPLPKVMTPPGPKLMGPFVTPKGPPLMGSKKKTSRY